MHETEKCVCFGGFALTGGAGPGRAQLWTFCLLGQVWMQSNLDVKFYFYNFAHIWAYTLLFEIIPS